MNDAQRFNYFSYNIVREKIEKDSITIPQLSHMTSIAPRTLYYILDSVENFEKTSYRNIQVLLCALEIEEKQVVDRYYREMYNLGDDTNTIAILNVVDGCYGFKLSDKNFKLIVELLRQLAEKSDDSQATIKFDVWVF